VLRCENCGHRFGRKARTVLVSGDFALCPRCGDDPAVHSKTFWMCRQSHTAHAHGDVVSIGRAREAIERIST
jgi:hypothetical protein